MQQAVESNASGFLASKPVSTPGIDTKRATTRGMQVGSEGTEQKTHNVLLQHHTLGPNSLIPELTVLF
jgi:hypothetical protein